MRRFSVVYCAEKRCKGSTVESKCIVCASHGRLVNEAALSIK